MAISPVQSSSSTGGPVTTLDVTLPSPTVTGNTLIVDIVFRSLTTSVAFSFVSLTDNKSNTYTDTGLLIENTINVVSGSNNRNTGLTFYCDGITGGSSHTLTLTLSAGTYCTMAVLEVSGEAVPSLDKTSSKVGDLSHNATHTCTATSTTSQAAELWHGFGFNNVINSFHTYSVSSPWNNNSENQADSIGQGTGIVTGNQVVSSTGTAAFVFTDAGSADDYFAMATTTWRAATAITITGGSLTLTGQTVSFTNSAPGRTVVVGALTLTGKTLLMSSALTAVKGDLTLTGKAVIFSNSAAGSTIFNVVKGSLTLNGKSAGLSSGASIIIGVRAPYLPSDTIGTKTYDLYDANGGLIGAGLTAGFFDSGNGNIANAWGVDMPVTPNLPYGDFAGVAVFNNINGTLKAALQLYSPPILPPSALTICEVAPFLTTDTVTTPGYIVRPSLGSFGSHVVTGIWAIPGVTNGYATPLTFTPASNGGYQYTILWDGG